MLLSGAAVLAGLVAGAAPSPASAGDRPDRPDRPGPAAATLEARATLPADFRAPGPPSGAMATAANGRTGPFPGQVIPGFSGLVDNGDGSFWGLPDNGFGAKTNSADFLLRLYRVRPDWRTGRLVVERHISLRDPARRVPFAVVNGSTPDRLLTGADFDVESVQRAADGSFWIGEEFGPYVLHVSASGEVLAPPIPFVGGKSPQNPTLQPGETARVRQSRGFEAMAASRDGRFLYPIVEGSFTDDAQPRRRWIYELDTRTSAYTDRTWSYRTDADPNVVGDAYIGRDGRLVLIERDDFDGDRAVTKKLYRVDLSRPEAPKELLVDLLDIRNPRAIGAGTGFGTGQPFQFPHQSVESVIPLRDGRLALVNDNNYPGNAARRPGTPDDTELIVLSLDERLPNRAFRRDHLVLAHRGASGYRPEHTLPAYELAIRQCADVIEPDLVSTKDGVLVARHENEISGTTDVAARPEFAGRKATKVIDGTSLEGWFTEDFTLAELKTLRARERLPQVRTANTAYDGLFDVPTFQEIIDLARRSRTCEGRPVGLYPELKHSTYFASIGMPLEEPLVRALRVNGLDRRDAPVFVQSFEVGNLRALDRMVDVNLVQLIDCSGGPADLEASGRTYAQMVTPAGLDEIARYADGVGVCKNLLVPRDGRDDLAAPAPVIADAHRRGLQVHAWTFRRENQYLPASFRSGTDPNAPADLVGEIRAFLAAGLDGFFTDNPDLGVQAARHIRQR
jgi:glycerophosphoryl diester phosphodiesterase